MSGTLALQFALAFDPPERQVAAMNHPATDKTAIEELARIWKSLDRERMKPLVNVYPLEPKLKLGEDSLGFGNKQDLTKYLAEIQPTIEEMIRVAARIPEQFGSPPSDSDESPNAHMEYPRAWIQNFERLLSADASWKWENAEADAAADRIGAVFRFAQWLWVQREDSNSPVIAVGLVVRNSKHLNAMLDDGMDKALSSDAKARLQSAMAEIEASDPGGLLRGWEDAAQNNVRWFRQEFLGEDGAKRYAEYLRTYGVFAGAVSDLSRFDAKAAEVWREIQGLVPEKDFAEKASGLTKEQLSAAIDEAEKLVSPLAVAIRAENIDSVRTLSTQIASDQTQVARCVIGPVVPTLQLSQSAREALAESKRRISESAK
ncbi:MAG: hypothetical protein KF691_01585 [Phycisphaeraceae bacterium]|nr:hypothetical protein [Phycisphaeraceae bacterium]